MKNLFFAFVLCFGCCLISCDPDELNSSFITACGEEVNTICLKCADGSDDCNLALRADGLMTIELTAHVPVDIKDQFNLISFKTSKGNFPGEVNKDNPQIKSQDGQASVTLNVGTVSGPGKVEASIVADNITYTAVFEFNLDPVEETGIEFLIEDEDPDTFDAEALADGKRIIKLTTQVDGLNVFNKKVKLSISGAWSFFDHSGTTTELTLTDVPKVECLIKMSQQPGSCVVRAEFEGRSELLQLDADPARAESIDLIPNPQVVAAVSGMTTLKAYLEREDGKVSLDSRLNFKAIQHQDAGVVELGFFDPPFGLSNSDEIVEVKFLTPADSIVVDSLPIWITSWVTDAPEIRDSIQLIVQ